MKIKKGKLFLLAVASVALVATLMNDKKNKCSCNENEEINKEIDEECGNCFELKN